ncbi:NAD-dependent epimerase/dehydratase family protein [Bradyrhizobium cosmicum]|uniref:NAD-dependent epimerase/dehydratase family protein n=1 Tax=Bradyrhizobium cosmicum TaxID=1404864 RepID=UPI0039655C1A
MIASAPALVVRTFKNLISGLRCLGRRSKDRSVRILLVGGTGLVGSAIHARLSAEGHECILVSRHPDAAPDTHHVTLDVGRTTDASKWKGILAGVDAVINGGGCPAGSGHARGSCRPVAQRFIRVRKAEVIA